MKWIALNDEVQLDSVKQNSRNRPQVIFKHSTRCSTSQLVKGRLERSEQPSGMDFYFLDLIANRQVSNKVAEVFHVPHESPQVLVIKDEACVYQESHLGISMDEIEVVGM